MKISADSNIGQKLEQWFARKKNEEERPSTSKRLETWLTEEEKKNDFFFIEEKSGKRRKILMLTSQRIILLEYDSCWQLKDTGDWIWKQFVAVHLAEGIFSSSLELFFLKDEVQKNQWLVKKLDKEAAKKFYSYLKSKEIAFKEERCRRQENLKTPSKNQHSNP